MLPMLLLLLALASNEAPPPRVGPDAAQLFSVEDYPKEAMINGWQGTVVAELTVSSAGPVSKCRIVRSSGHKILDEKTCEILFARAKFIPAKDIDGRPTVDTLRTPPIVWRIESPPRGTPNLADLPEGWQGKARARLVISAQGNVSACEIIESSGNKIVDNVTCGLLTQRARFKPALDQDGNPIQDTVSQEVGWQVKDHSLRMTDPPKVRE